MTETLQSLPDITRLSDRVVRILGQNPGKFTLQGTNTYLVGASPPFVLIDTGEGREEYTPLLESALRSFTPSTSSSPAPGVPLVSDIVLTHRHHDHVNGLPSVLTLLHKLWSQSNEAGSEEAYVPPRLHKLLPGSSATSPSETAEAALESLLATLPPHSFTSSASGLPLHPLDPSTPLKTPSCVLTVVPTPGHTPDSVCLLLAEERALFAGDTVLGQGTAVFEDLGAYIASLRALLSLPKGEGGGAAFKTLYPGHGPVVDDGPELIEEYIRHRLEREAQIVQVLQTESEDREREREGVWTIQDIVAVIYKDYPQNLWAPAARGVRLHLRKLEDEGRVRCLGGGEGLDEKWKVSSKL